MQYVIIAKDANDSEALQRRLKARADHVSYSDEAVKRGEQIIGAALLDKEGDMRGSVMIVDFESEDALKKWLDNEAYVRGKVWKDIDIIPCRVGPSFAHCLLKSA
ncbi:MAG: YciI family protein [Pseudomonadota bacterium]